MRVVPTHILPIYPKEVMVQWDIQDADPGRTAGMTFTIERSGSPRGEWKEVATGLSTVYYRDTFEDSSDDTTEHSLFSLEREIWYRIVAVLADGDRVASRPIDTRGVVEPTLTDVDAIGPTTHVDTAQTYPSPDTQFQTHPRLKRRLQLVQNVVMRRAIIALEAFTGVYLAVLKKRHFGDRCPDCYDPNTKQILYSGCQTCYGTGWDGGFFPAFPTLGRVTENPEQIQIEQEGETEILRSQIDTIHFPRLFRHDILVELDSNRRWEVDRVTSPQLRRRRVLQFTQCTELARTSAVYDVPVEITEPLEFNYGTIES